MEDLSFMEIHAGSTTHIFKPNSLICKLHSQKHSSSPKSENLILTKSVFNKISSYSVVVYRKAGSFVADGIYISKTFPGSNAGRFISLCLDSLSQLFRFVSFYRIAQVRLTCTWAFYRILSFPKRSFRFGFISNSNSCLSGS